MSQHNKMFNFNPKLKKNFIFNLEPFKQDLILVLCVFRLVLLVHGCYLNLERSFRYHRLFYCKWKLYLVTTTLFNLEIDSSLEYSFFLDLSNFIVRASLSTLLIDVWINL